jgi:hypothetical protein
MINITYQVKPLVSFNAVKTAAIYPNPTVFMGGLDKKTLDAPPINNMGETVFGSGDAIRQNAVEIQAIASKSEMLVMVGGKPKMLPVRLPSGGHVAVLDWLNVTVGLETFDPDYSAKYLQAKQESAEEFFIHDTVQDMAAYPHKCPVPARLSRQ